MIMFDFLQIYEDEVIKRGFKEDPEQLKLASALNDLAQNLLSKKQEKRTLASLIRKKKKSLNHGVYIYGPVGRGKSFVTDLFFEKLPLQKKARTHFHQFMLSVHEFIHAQKGRADLNQAIPLFARDLKSKAQILCFDEFHVTDVADAMILGRLFNAIWDEGISIVTTSNWAPDTLYKNGIQRDRFLPFIEKIKTDMSVVSLENDTDYRMKHLFNIERYVYPLGPHTKHHMDKTFSLLIDGKEPESKILKIKGHDFFVPQYEGSIARFGYKDIIQKNYAAADFIELCKVFSTIMIDDIPALSPEQRDEAKRLMTLIDTMYEYKINLIASAAVSPEKIYSEGTLAFEFQRTVSRIMEMMTNEYVALHTKEQKAG